MVTVERVLRPLVEVRPKEVLTAVLLFAYSFLAMAVWNTIKPLTRSQFIRDLGADNLPYVLLAAGLLIGVVMAGYSWLMARLPRRWGLPIVQVGMGGLLVVFWLLLESGAAWVSVAFYVVGLIFGLLLISQFWTVANLVYDPRQAKRLFGFIGGGAPLGGMAGSAFAALGAKRMGSLDLLLPSAAVMFLAAGVTAWIIHRENLASDAATPAGADAPRGVGLGEAWRLLQSSPHLKLIALVISLASIGAALIEQQLNMAAEAHHGSEATDAITAALGWVGVWTSGIGLLIQVWLTSRVHRYLGLGFALMVLPVMLGTSAVVMLLNAALWAPALARVADQSLRYTLDKTSREILFLPLPDALKLKAKPFVDVSVDRVARAGAALLLILLVQPWALNLDWQSISYASLTIMGLWLAMALRARRSYLRALRESIERQDFAPADMRLSGADLTTVETLVQELAHVDARRVLYAIDVLESLGKRHLVTPLLLRHESPAVRERALRAMAAARDGVTTEWLPQIRRLLEDDAPGVRAGAVRTLAAVHNEDALARARAMATEPNARIRATAAIVLAASPSPADVALAEATLIDLAGDVSELGRPARREAAAAIRDIADPKCRELLRPLLHDPAVDVAETALRSLRAAGDAAGLFVPTLVSLLAHRQLVGPARDALVDAGESVVDALAAALADRGADIWVRRHVPSTLARIPSQRSVDVLVEALADPDACIRFKATAGLRRLRQSGAALTIPRLPVERQAISEAGRYFRSLSVHDTLFRPGGFDAGSLLARALQGEMARAKRRIYGLLCLIEPWQDVVAATGALDRGDAHRRSSASEYLDNLLPGDLRRWLMPILEDLPIDDKVRQGRALIGMAPRSIDDTLRQLFTDDDGVVAAAAIALMRQAGLWRLVADVEHLLRDVQDPYARDAARWALAEHRVHTGRAPDGPLPAVVIAERLATVPLFAGAAVDELFAVAATARQVRHEAGALLAEAGVAPRFVHVLLEGTAITVGSGGIETTTPPAVLGLAEALRAVPMPGALRADSPSVTLAFTLDELLTLLGDNAQLVSGLFATLLDGAGWADVTVERTAAADQFDRFTADGVAPAEKVVVLEFVPLFAGLSANNARRVADIARTVRLEAGSPLFEASASPAIWIVLKGQVALEAPGQEPMVASGGDVVGALATLAGYGLDRAGRVLASGVALRIDRDELVDLWTDRPGLLRQLLATTLRSMDLPPARPVSGAPARAVALTA
jgi:ATP/ADP translocase/HEAT repeat protein